MIGMIDDHQKFVGLLLGRQLVVGIVLLAGATAIACSGMSSQPEKFEAPSQSGSCGTGKILLLTVEEGGPGIPGVQVKLINPAGSRILGASGALGDFCIDRSEFDSSAEEYVTFCREGYFCGVFNVQKDVVRFDERIIALARVVLR